MRFLPASLLVACAMLTMVLIGCPSGSGQEAEGIGAVSSTAQVDGVEPATTDQDRQGSSPDAGKASSSGDAQKTTWRPFIDPGMSLEQISGLGQQEARARLEELGVPFAAHNFHESIEIDPVELTALFLQAGMDVDEPNHAGVSPVQVAAIKGKPEHAKLLMESGADLEYEDPVFSSNVTDFAVTGGSVEMLEQVLEAGAPPGGGPNSMPLLIDAVQSGNLEMFRYVLERFPDPTVRDRFGQSVLMRACLMGETEIARELIEAGADIHEAEPRGGTILGAAAYSGNWELVRTLIDMGADPYESYRGGRNLFFELAGNPGIPLDLAESLIDGGLDVNQVEELSNVTPLIVAAQFGNVPMARILLENGADPDVADSNGKTAHDYAVLAQNGEMLALFARYGITGDGGPEVDQ